DLDGGRSEGAAHDQDVRPAHRNNDYGVDQYQPQPTGSIALPDSLRLHSEKRTGRTWWRPRTGRPRPRPPVKIDLWGIRLTQVARVLWRDVGRAPSPAAGPLAGLPAGGRGCPPRSRGTAPQSRCQSDYQSQADTPERSFLRSTAPPTLPVYSPGSCACRLPEWPPASSRFQIGRASWRERV